MSEYITLKDGEMWFGDVPVHWGIKRIGQLYHERKQKVSDKDYPPLSVTMQGILPQLEHAAKTDAHDDRKLIRKGDFVINSRSDRRGSCGISPADGSCSLINTVLEPRAEMNPLYYNWFFHTVRFGEEFYRWGHGIHDDLWTTNYEEMKRIFLPVPPLPEQEVIASYLVSKCSAIDEVIERHKKIIEKLEEYRTASITSAVTHSKTATYYKPSKTYAHEIPDHWEETNLGNLVYSMRNGYVGPTRDILVDEGVRYIQSLHVKNGKLLFENSPFYVTEMWGNIHPKIKTGDLLIVQTGDIGQVAVVTEEYNDCNCHALIIARTRTDIIFPEYLAYYCRSRVGLTELLLTATGATLPHLNSGAIKYCTVIIPPILEQKEIIDSLHEIEARIDKQIEVHENIITKLEEYRKSIIYNAVTGKIDCREAPNECNT